MRPPFAFPHSVQARSNTDLRRAISRQAWLANRARNALHRPAFIGAISVATFVTALVSMVVVPRAQQRPVVPIPSEPRPDTLTLVTNAAIARLRMAQADSALGAVRQKIAADEQRRQAEALLAAQTMDSLSQNQPARRDSVIARMGTLERAVNRAEQAPLPQSYRALAELPELRDDTRVRALMDSLVDIEREREGFGAVGGVDPIFVALTSRAMEIGRGIQVIANQRLDLMRAELLTLQPAAPPVAQTSVTDTSLQVATRDSALAVIALMGTELATARERSRALDLDEERAREKANAVAPPMALLAAAFVLSAVIGFATAFFRELRQPRVANASELERLLGVRVLSTVETPMPSIERGRRQADRSAPPYFDPGAEGYQLAYLALATDHPAVLNVTVTGDDHAIVAVVACNLAAVAADEARNTLIVDLDPECSASAALRSRVEPGIADVLRNDSSWPDVTVAARVGRDKTVDLVPHGIGAIGAEQIVALLRKDAQRLARYYDAIITVARADLVVAGLTGALSSAAVVYCAQPGLTPLRELQIQLESVRAAGGNIRGLVLWNAERPLLPTPRELASRSHRARAKEPVVATASA